MRYFGVKQFKFLFFANQNKRQSSPRLMTHEEIKKSRTQKETHYYHVLRNFSWYHIVAPFYYSQKYKLHEIKMGTFYLYVTFEEFEGNFLVFKNVFHYIDFWGITSNSGFDSTWSRFKVWRCAGWRNPYLIQIFCNFDSLWEGMFLAAHAKEHRLWWREWIGMLCNF